jgi:iron complex outermembrane receptor protein
LELVLLHCSRSLDLLFSKRKINDIKTDGETTISGDIGFTLGEDGFIHLAFESRDRAPTTREGYEGRPVYSPLNNGDIDPKELAFDHANNFQVGRADIQDLTFVYNLGYR